MSIIGTENQIQSLIGHRSLASLKRYLGVTEQQKENAISTLVFKIMYSFLTIKSYISCHLI
ncbi:hypothetical protein F8S12_22315 [Nostoc sp. WHI]|nr:hypothetical protein [Nostoc sp. WHI]